MALRRSQTLRWDNRLRPYLKLVYVEEFESLCLMKGIFGRGSESMPIYQAMCVPGHDGSV